MKIFDTESGVKAGMIDITGPIGLVPTMGSLHEGHMSLVRRACNENAATVVSIFVNPTQFAPADDYINYPRGINSDLTKLKDAGVDFVFSPSKDEMYPVGFDSYVDVGRIGTRLEGISRPGHLRGVATVVCKLLSIIRPDRAYFGQKDAQQGLVINRLNSDLNLGAEIVMCPTVREPDGLAFSSRNSYLSPMERKASIVLYRALSQAIDMTTVDAREIRERVLSALQAEPMVEVDYVSVADTKTLEELYFLERPALVSIAVRIGKTRLIDNCVIN